MKIAITSDHRGSHLIDALRQLVNTNGHQLVEVNTANGEPCDYPDMAFAACRAIVDGQADRAILVCGSGIGMTIAANKFPGIRAALVHDDIGAQMSRRHNDANVVCLAADLLGPRLVESIVATWLSAEFEAGRHQRRVNKISAIERGENPAAITE
ncbi:ribose 5-phosphate isomerase B [Planctomycetales bacterium ZRK34]|nr:ribose 5-phosphate isomerase B [Planctomycetales bacterium ZRK34]